MHHNTVPHHFDSHQPTAGAPANRKLIQCVVQLAQLGHERNVLDIGCGYGQNTGLLRKFSRGLVVGLDSDESVLNHGGNGVLTVLGDCCDLPFRRDSFNCVTAFFIVQLVKSLNRMVRETHRVLKVGGVLFIPLPTRDDIRNRRLNLLLPWLPGVDKRRYPSIPQLCRLLKNNGFSIKTQRVSLGKVRADLNYFCINLALKLRSIRRLKNREITGIIRRSATELRCAADQPQVFEYFRTLVIAKKL